MRPLYSLFVFCLFLTSPCLAETAPGNNRPVILVLGDSLSAGFGIDQSRSWVNLLEEKLKIENYPHEVFNASISGETSLGGVNRLPELLKQSPEIVVIELGANDGLRGLPLPLLKENLEKMITLSKSSGAEILLIGMKLPPNYGPAYTNGFQDTYKKLADKYGIKLVPFLLSGIATQRQLMQNDNLHPTTEAQPFILKNVWPHLVSLIQTAMKK